MLVVYVNVNSIFSITFNQNDKIAFSSIKQFFNKSLGFCSKVWFNNK